jgi:hypothetical protein
MNILVINHSTESCGVHQYGKRVGKILEKSKENNFFYYELESHRELDEKIKQHNPHAIIYNHLGGTMPWVTKETTSVLRNQGIVQHLLVHNLHYSTFFDYYLHQDPYWKSVDEKNFAIPRPLPFYEKTSNIKNDDVIKIGSFGFGLTNKYYHEICRVVNEQFEEESVEINLHLTAGKFCGNTLNIPLVAQMCNETITNSNIKLNITTDFISDNDLLKFLSNNDLNVFFYENYSCYNGISSVIDYALAVQKPIAINRSNMYSHILDVEPSICVEDNYLIDIIKNGFTPLQKKYNSWTHEKFIHRLNEILKKTIEV